MLSNTLLLLLLLWGQDSVWSVRLVELRVPAHERVGGVALLGCQYDLEGDVLYSVKWYKDEQEFYRYIPRNNPQIISFKRPGVHVNMKRSSSTVVALENLTLESEGNYSCEVSGEGPNFTTAKSEKRINIHLLPEGGPIVTGLQRQYFLDDVVMANCTSLPSKPKAHLKWLINGDEVTESYLVGPWYRMSTTIPEATETILQLRFIVAPRHFVDGEMNLKCQATIAPLFQRETKSSHFIALPFTATIKTASLDFSIDDDHAPSESTKLHTHFKVLLITIAFFVNVFLIM